MAHLAWLLPVLACMIASSTSDQKIALDNLNCPVGPGVYGDKILIGTNATCKCDFVAVGSPKESAGWYTEDNRLIGEVDTNTSSSTFTFSYDPTDSRQSYKCRPQSTSSADVESVIYTPIFRCAYVIVEVGHSTQFQCPVSDNVQSITWQLRENRQLTDISTCNLVDNTCNDLMASLYQAFVTGSGSDRVTGLKIISAKFNETHFSYLMDNGMTSTISELEVYAWPDKPRCTQTLKNTAINIVCYTDNIYPNVQATFHRRQTNFAPSDVYPSNACELGRYILFEEFINFASCTLEIPEDQMIIPNSHIYVEMRAVVSRMSEINRTASISDDVITDSILPTVALSDCPQGQGVKNDTILAGTSATCKCEATRSNVSDGFARWFTSKGQMVGTELNRQSILMFSYNATEKNETFSCYAITPFKRAVSVKYYTPKFRSTAPSIAVTGLKTLVVILGAVCSGIVSLLP